LKLTIFTGKVLASVSERLAIPTTLLELRSPPLICMEISLHKIPYHISAIIKPENEFVDIKTNMHLKKQ